MVEAFVQPASVTGDPASDVFQPLGPELAVTHTATLVRGAQSRVSSSPTHFRATSVRLVPTHAQLSNEPADAP